MATVSQKLGDCGDCGASAQAHGQRGRRRHGRISAVARELVRAVDLDPSSTQTLCMIVAATTRFKADNFGPMFIPPVDIVGSGKLDMEDHLFRTSTPIHHSSSGHY
ncbi:hypothetical protein [Oryza sativa Japonica Group]|uniref:Uncharacterized protein n=1 Tax=Oryza sativa subsp. japonica TaxID=39947 RepID=Q5Z8D8_ORYSJ|nr:hypothetical protein [Oryza sativa Japonica Group]BAD53946.1 hypothetical protein [Oryza sativa Japonica Group]